MSEITEQQRKELEKLYPKEDAREALQGLMAEIRPQRFFHIWAWGMKTQYIIGQLPTLLFAIFFIYIINPWVPKDVWSVAIAVCILVVSLFAFIIGMYIPPLKAAAFRYLSCCFFMGGEPAVGLSRELATFPYVEPETPVQLERISDQEIRDYLKVIRLRLQKQYTRQRQRLNQMGVSTPPEEPEPPKENLGTFFKTLPKRSLGELLHDFFVRPTFFVALIFFVSAYTYTALLPVLLFMVLGVPLLELIVMLMPGILVVIGFLLLIPWRFFRRSIPMLKVKE